MMIFTVYNLNLKVVEKLEVCCFENSFYTIFIYLRGTDLLSKYQVETIWPTDEHKINFLTKLG